MKKENMVSSVTQQPIARITRARAAALKQAGGMSSAELSKKQDQRQALQTNLKRTASNETRVENKRRPVLQDVTNICCEDSYKIGLGASRIQKKNNKQARKGSANVSKVVPSVAIGVQKLKANTEAKTTNTEAKTSQALTSELKIVNICGTDSPLKKQFLRNHLRHSSSKKEEGIQLTTSEPNFEDIDSDHKDPQLCSVYAPEIYSNLRVAELIRKPTPNFIETIQRDITPSMRGILVDWLVEVSEEYKLVPDTLYLTVYLIDLFLSQNYIERPKLQLVGITCMLIASKYEEICAPSIDEFCVITDNTYTKAEVLAMESQVLNYLGFQLSAPTAKTFLRRFLRAAQASYKTSSLELECLANYLAELTLVDYGFLKFLPSAIAASAVFLARWTLQQSGHPWNPTLEHYTNYKASDLKTIVTGLQCLQHNTDGCRVNAICAKYRNDKFKCVATLPSPELLETLFLT